MKKILFLLLIVVGISIRSNAQAVDSSILARSIERGNKAVITAIDNQSKFLKDSVMSIAKLNSKAGSLKANETVADFITFLPIGLFVFILLTVLIKLKKEKVKLSSFLVDKDTQVDLKKEEATMAVANAKIAEAKISAIKTNPQLFTNASIALAEIEQPAQIRTENDSIGQEQSTSRLIAFISGVSPIALAACITSFYFYRSFLGDGNVNIGNLATVLYGLGLGVLPYGFNKISNALK